LLETLILIENNEDEELEIEDEIEFINLFRLIYKNRYHELMSKLDQYDLLNDRQKLKVVIIKFLDYCQKLYQVILNNSNDSSDLSNLAKALDREKFFDVIRFLPEFYRFIDGYINLNLLWLKLFFLINKSFNK